MMICQRSIPSNVSNTTIKNYDSSPVESPTLHKNSVMICIECSEPVDSLYTKYAQDYIKLTDCPRCSKVADKYVEFDNVILFIDTLLLKPQAYRHLVFNLMSDEKSESGGTKSILPLKNWFGGSQKVSRIRLLMILFEIYLNWAYEEKNFNFEEFRNPYLIMNAILTKSAIIQYLYFSVKCISDDLITHTLIPFMIFNFIQWNPKGYVSQSLETKRYYQMALSLTILLSGATKLFPILMLIWPYNNISITNIISSLADLNLIEALKIVTDCSSVQATLLFVINSITKFVLTRGLLIMMLSRGNKELAHKFMINESANFMHKASILEDTIINSYKSAFM